MVVKSDVLLNGKVDGNYHLGHVMLDCLKRRRPDDICQVEAASGNEETYGSVLARSTKLARCLRRACFQPGDVITVSGRNHLDLRIPLYAATFNGYPVAGVDPLFKLDEIKSLLKITQPKICFCEYETYDAYAQAAKDLEFNVEIITFEKGENEMSKFVEKYDDNNSDEFRPAYFDTDKIYVWLISTSGTTGVPKVAAFKHGTIINMFRQLCSFGMLGSFVEGGQKTAISVSPPQWFTGYVNSFGFPLTNTCIVQTTNMSSLGHLIDIINKYKPAVVLTSPSFLARILKEDKPCDLTSFDFIGVGGAKVYTEILTGLRNRVRPDTDIRELYGQTESAGIILGVAPSNGPVGSISAKNIWQQIKLVDTVTGKEITEPNQSGELWYKGESFTEYYNNACETANVITEDGWIKSGDLLYKDENDLYYFVDRIKMLIKYRNIQVIPPEIEEIILIHPGVLEVCVTSVPHPEDSQHPVACVVRRKGCDVTAQEIKDLVAEKLSENKQLRGGVVFMDELPKTSSGKVNRVKAKEIVLNAKRE